MITEQPGYLAVSHDVPLPCPFCGWKAELCQLAHEISSVKQGRKWVQKTVCIIASSRTLAADTFWFKCPMCRCTSGPHCSTAQEAVEHWNKRS